MVVVWEDVECGLFEDAAVEVDRGVAGVGYVGYIVQPFFEAFV